MSDQLNYRTTKNQEIEHLSYGKEMDSSISPLIQSTRRMDGILICHRMPIMMDIYIITGSISTLDIQEKRIRLMLMSNS
jgi:hypothetical protein